MKAVPFEKLVHAICQMALFKNTAGDLRIVPLSWRGGTMGQFLHSINGVVPTNFSKWNSPNYPCFQCVGLSSISA